jgi:hypothetical protein
MFRCLRPLRRLPRHSCRERPMMNARIKPPGWQEFMTVKRSQFADMQRSFMAPVYVGCLAKAV